jgi:hypothetical protein
MELGELELEVGESIIVDYLYIHRNEHAYLILRQRNELEDNDNALFINDIFYRLYYVEDLSTYKLSDFE